MRVSPILRVWKQGLPANTKFEFVIHRTRGDVTIETYGSAWHGDGGNCKSNYVAEMAEKRALSRVVLKTIGAYKFMIYGEDESDDFKEKSK